MNDVFLGKGEQAVHLLGRYGNRHGLIAGATGTGKSVSLMVLAEGFSRIGVPVFLADVKGDLAGLSQAAVANDKLNARIAKLSMSDWQAAANPVVFWDIHGHKGHPVRTTVSEMGPELLSRLLELNDTQEGVIQIAFKVADDHGLLLLDLDDLRAMLAYVGEHAKEISMRYGLVAPQSIGAIQRALLQLDNQGGGKFFGEPALDLNDFIRCDLSGRGIINVLAADLLILKPRVYTSFLLWMLSELLEKLPEVGDADRPRLVFFFDEAHLLFNDAPPALKQRVEQVVRLIRSKGVGIYFISQLPDDVPDAVLGQLGNRVQHALRAFTPRDQKAVKAAAETFPPNPHFQVIDAITKLGVGEALVTTLQEGGVPLPVERALIAPPRSRIGTISDEERARVRGASPVGAKYDTAINRESAYERLRQRATEAAPAPSPSASPGNNPPAKTPTPDPVATGSTGPDWGDRVKGFLFGTSRRQGALEAFAKSAMRNAGNRLTNQILRGVLGGVSRRR